MEAHNLQRRDLTTDERALAAAAIADLRRGAPYGNVNKKSNPPTGGIDVNPHSTAAVAKRFGVSERAIARTIVVGYGAGRIVLPKPNGKASHNQLRVAPSFKPVGTDARPTSTSHTYTVESLMAFLGWKEHKVRAAIEALAAVEDHPIDLDDYQASFPVLLETWEAADKFCRASVEAREVQSIEIARLLDWAQSKGEIGRERDDKMTAVASACNAAHKLIASGHMGYAVSMDIKRLHRFVACARSKMQAQPEAFAPYGHFPRDCCDPAAQMIGRCLVDHFGAEVAVVLRRRDAPIIHHTWLSIGEVIVDVTHDQWARAQTGLPCNQWVFEQSTPWHDSFEAEAPRIESLGPLLSADELRKTFPTLFERIATCAREA